MKLTVELVPSTSWAKNVRSEFTTSAWKRITKKAKEAAGYVCEICGKTGRKGRIECHEIWEYDDKTHVQTLTGFIMLCPKCHRVKHLGRTLSVGLAGEALAHLAEVNSLTPREVSDYVESVFAQWMARSRHEWEVNIDYAFTYLGH